MKRLITIVLLAISINCVAQSDLAGTQAPAVVFQGSPDKSPKADFYKGKILVLDFWATWCAPCIAGFPHFNTLSKKYGNNDIVFAAITDEPVERARAFFKRTKKELDAIKLCDTSKQTLGAFKIIFIPYCVVVGKDNEVKWIGSSDDLTDAILDKVIAGESIAPTKRKPGNKLSAVKPKPIFSFSVTKSDTANDITITASSFDRKLNYLSLIANKTSIASCLEKLTGFGKTTRILTNDSVKIGQMIDMEFRAGADTALFSDYKNTILKNNARNNFIIKLIGEAMKFEASVSVKPQKHYELIVIDTAKLYKFRSMQTGHSSLDSDHYPAFEVVGYNLPDIAVNLEASFGQIITTKITDKSRYDLSLNFSNITALNKTLALHGLKLIEVTGNIEFLNVNFQ